MDNEEIVTELFRRTRQKVDPQDPVFLVVELNQIIMEDKANQIAERVSVVADGFERITRRSADEFIDAINNASSVLQGQVTALEAAAQKVTVPEYLAKKHPGEELAESKGKADGDFKKEFVHTMTIAGIFGFGLVCGLLIAGFMWVFFR